MLDAIAGKAGCVRILPDRELLAAREVIDRESADHESFTAMEPALLVELPSADGCVALNDSETLASLRSDPTMTADAMAHLTALQGEISKVMKTLQTTK